MYLKIKVWPYCDVLYYFDLVTEMFDFMINMPWHQRILEITWSHWNFWSNVDLYGYRMTRWRTWSASTWWATGRVRISGSPVWNITRFSASTFRTLRQRKSSPWDPSSATGEWAAQTGKSYTWPGVIYPGDAVLCVLELSSWGVDHQV